MPLQQVSDRRLCDTMNPQPLPRPRNPQEPPACDAERRQWIKGSVIEAGAFQLQTLLNTRLAIPTLN